MRYGNTVRRLTPQTHSVEVNGERFDAAVLAVSPQVAARLLEHALAEQGSGGLLRALQAFDYEPIATLNLRLAGPWPLPEPMMMLREEPARGFHGQWLFDRSRLTGRGERGELAVVVSAARAVAAADREQAIAALTRQVAEQARRHPARLAPMPAVEIAELFVEKRATFAAMPGLARPLNSTPWRCWRWPATGPTRATPACSKARCAAACKPPASCSAARPRRTETWRPPPGSAQQQAHGRQPQPGHGQRTGQARAGVGRRGRVDTPLQHVDGLGRKVENVVSPPRKPVTAASRIQAGHSGWLAISATITPIR